MLSNPVSQVHPITRCLSHVLSRSFFGLQLAYWRHASSHIQQLPPEVVAEIFTHCLPADHERAVASTRAAPLNVAAVCKSWRQLALTTPRLWVRFDVVQKTSPTGDISVRTQMDTWVQRSACILPLSFSLSFTRAGGRGESEDKDDEPILCSRHFTRSISSLSKTLLGCQERWKRVYIDYSHAGEFSSKLRVEMRGMRLLEDLYLCLPNGGASATVNLSSSPNLRRLSLSGDFTLCLGEATLPKLKSASFDTDMHLRLMTTVDDILTLLRQAPNLEVLSANVLGSAYSVMPVEAIHLPFLRALTLTFYHADGPAVQSLLGMLALPALESLNITIDHHSNTNVSFGLADLLSRSQAPLTTFALTASAVSVEETIACLRLSPRLKDLSLVDQLFNVSEMGEIITALMLSDDVDASSETQNLCPELEALAFSAYRLRNLYDMFATMVASRWDVENGRRSLREVRVKSRDTWLLEKVQMKSCIEDGLQVKTI